MNIPVETPTIDTLLARLTAARERAEALRREVRAAFEDLDALLARMEAEHTREERWK